MAVLRLSEFGAWGHAPMFMPRRVSAPFQGRSSYPRLLVVSRCPFPYDAVSIGSFNAEAIRGQLSNV